MRIKEQFKQRQGAFTLMEAMVAVGVFATLFTSLYIAFSAGFTVMRVARENLRATQILTERCETTRLYTWDQLTDTAYFSPTFIVTNSYSTLGTIYYGKAILSQPANMGTPTYLADMKCLTVEVRWTNGLGKPLPHYRQMQTQVARYGMQNYVFGGKLQ